MLIDKNYLESLTIDSLTKLENLIKREKKIRKGVFKDKITSIILNKLLNNSLMSTNLLKYLTIIKGGVTPLKNIVASKELNQVLKIEIQKFLAKINIEDLLVFNEKKFSLSENNISNFIFYLWCGGQHSFDLCFEFLSKIYKNSSLNDSDISFLKKCKTNIPIYKNFDNPEFFLAEFLKEINKEYIIKFNYLDIQHQFTLNSKNLFF